MGESLICTTCGTQYGSLVTGDRLCPICLDERQYIPESGQAWTTLENLKTVHSVHTKKLHQQLYELKIVPSFAIGQRALLVLAPSGNILWDCIALLDEPTIAFIRSLGGLKAMAFSHPHYYTTMNVWADEFNCPIYIHQKDESWIFNRGEKVQLWQGIEKGLWDGIRLINIGGHFPGSSILHVPFLSAKGTILCGDTFYISPSKQHMAPMYSYPNKIPLPLQEVGRIRASMEPIMFDSMFGFYDFQNVYENARDILLASLGRYV